MKKLYGENRYKINSVDKNIAIDRYKDRLNTMALNLASIEIQPTLKSLEKKYKTKLGVGV